MQATNCIICHGRVRSYASYGRFQVEKCRKCGFGQTNVTEQDVAEIYGEQYFAPYFGGKTTVFGEDRTAELHDGIDAAKKWWLDRFVQGDRLRCLEIGPGPSGALQRYLTQRHPNLSYEVIEPSKFACESLRARNITVHEGTVYDTGIAEKIAGRFDYVIATEVIEHDLNPRKFVSGLFNSLKPGGHALLTTGNFNGLTARVMGKRWYYLQPPVHVCIYTPASVRKVFTELGFSKVTVECIGLNWVRLRKKIPVPGLLWLTGALQLPTGMTVFATK